MNRYKAPCNIYSMQVLFVDVEVRGSHHIHILGSRQHMMFDNLSWVSILLLSVFSYFFTFGQSMLKKSGIADSYTVFSLFKVMHLRFLIIVIFCLGHLLLEIGLYKM